MRILFLCTRHNSLSQRLQVELEDCGHEIVVAEVASGEQMEAAALAADPALIVAPMLKRAIPPSVWKRWTSLIVHPGIPGDRGPSALDWAILDGAAEWGLTVLEARAELDAGPVWASAEFPMRAVSKSALYRRESTQAAVDAVLRAVATFDGGARPPRLPVGEQRGRERPACRQADRRFDWRESSARILACIRSGDSAPGTLARVAGESLHVFGAHEEGRLRGEPGALLARRDEAICVATGDGAIWLSHLRRKDGIKLPATQVLGERAQALPELALPAQEQPDHATYQDIRYRERGRFGLLHFDFLNGAMSTTNCARLLAAYRHACERPTRAIVLCGGGDFWSNGIDLNAIEAAADPAEESWRNILAMNALVRAIATTSDKLVISVLQGNAGAGGVTLALAADRVYARDGVVLNPHYKRMGGLYGSEFWTYLMPRRVGEATARHLTDSLAPVGTARAARIGLIDGALDGDALIERVLRIVEPELGFWRYRAALALKVRQREQDERSKPLDRYAEEELAEMHSNFFGADRSYHEARRRFVWKLCAEPVCAAVTARETA
ncbi:hydrogenase maturation protein [Dokdonella sp.]|uniref:hydrogenase maturation protein n=1 Tax=Dokdonella sp. TaxID=2291710 RepID=UPI001B2B3F23|nr:hydrogenase maturation protein [Dokdonella sp.]MBO9663056.1 hydrogenase maturation protein [Dokdonella sp.]